MDGPSRVCFRNASKTETMMTVSRVSRKTMRNTGTEKTFLPMVADDFNLYSACDRIDSIKKCGRPE